MLQGQSKNRNICFAATEKTNFLDMSVYMHQNWIYSISFGLQFNPKQLFNPQVINKETL